MRCMARGGERELRLFEGDDHAGCAREAERVVAGFALECAGVGVRGNERGMGEVMVGEEERVELVWKGGDLREGRKRGVDVGGVFFPWTDTGRWFDIYF